MRTSLGISAGAEVVCSALVTTASNGAQSFDYRIVSADAANSDLGDLVMSSIELMTTRLSTPTPREIIPPVGRRFAGTQHNAEAVADRPLTSVAVAYRSKEQAVIIRSATGKHHEPRLVPEGTAALTYLRHTGLFARYNTIAIVDLGATGLTVTVADQTDGSLLRSDRTASVSGRAIDDLIYQHLVNLHFNRRGTRPNRTTLTNRGRAAKEHLSIAPAVTIDHIAGRPLKLTRNDFEKLIADLLRTMVVFVTTAFAKAPQPPQAVAVIGGGANIPSVIDALTTALDIPVLTVPDPEAVTAKGAALVADSMQPTALPVGTSGDDTPTETFAKVFGTVAGAIVVVGLIVGYGVKTFTPSSNNEVSPVGTTSSTFPSPLPVLPSAPVITTTADTPKSVIRPTGTGGTQATGTREPQRGTSIPSNTPAITPTRITLRPDPDIPPIPFPELLVPMLSDPTIPQSSPADPAPEGQSADPAPEDKNADPAPSPETSVTRSAPTPPPPPLPPRANSGSASRGMLTTPS
ncbi:Hsp70 family protein [Nocardia sp. 004]|uniref:Hsp70 family protein n=1 Tax=Nocardia sp. 004 TaxID=3385978 RepID=UPI0039A32428